MTDTYPTSPGFYAHAPETSRDAAESIADVAGSIRARVFNIVAAAGAHGAIGDDVASALDLHVTQVRSRLSELVADKRIVDSKRRREGKSGRRGAVWVLPEYGPPPPVVEYDQGDLWEARDAG